MLCLGLFAKVPPPAGRHCLLTIFKLVLDNAQKKDIMKGKDDPPERDAFESAKENTRMKFFHVYREEWVEGLVKNGLINRDSGFKLQHDFPIPKRYLFNEYAAKDTPLYRFIKENRFPFYIDRIAGGTTFMPGYTFDKGLIEEYRNLLGDAFLGFQLHESVSNRRGSDWGKILRVTGKRSGFDAEELRRLFLSDHAITADGEYLVSFSQGTPEEYAGMTYAENIPDFLVEVRQLFQKYMDMTANAILPVDSGQIFAKLQAEMGMTAIMPEIGQQISLTRLAVATARGVAESYKKKWGTYYECWRADWFPETKKCAYNMPCFSTDPFNEWGLSQAQHGGDDFTTHGVNGGCSRLLQERIYYHSLLSGADYMSEEWGFRCSYYDTKDYALTPYGEIKKRFLNHALDIGKVRALTPFALVLPTDCPCVETTDRLVTHRIGDRRGVYMRNISLSPSETEHYGHIDNMYTLLFNRTEDTYGNESHALTNGLFGDVFDVIYADASDETLSKYAYLIDATKDSSFARAKVGCGYRILESADIYKLKAELDTLIPAVMPVFVDGLHWLVSQGEDGRRYLAIFNNEGNERTTEKGDTINHAYDRRVTVTLKDGTLSVYKSAGGNMDIERKDAHTFCVTIPAADFAIFTY